jgi:hypothetical protein
MLDCLFVVIIIDHERTPRLLKPRKPRIVRKTGKTAIPHRTRIRPSPQQLSMTKHSIQMVSKTGTAMEMGMGMALPIASRSFNLTIFSSFVPFL